MGHGDFAEKKRREPSDNLSAFSVSAAVEDTHPTCGITFRALPQLRRDEEHEGRTEEIFMFFVPSWLIFILFRAPP